MSQRIESIYSVRDIPAPLTSDRDSDVEWMCKCFGFMEPRDKRRTAAKIFAVLVENANNDNGMSSDEIAEKVGVTRAGVIHHLSKMIGSGLAIQRQEGYKLRTRSVESTIIEVQRDIARVFENLTRIAREIDRTMNIPTGRDSKPPWLLFDHH